MPWNDDLREAFFLLVEAGWPGEFTDEHRTAWATLLDPYDPSEVVDALRHLIAKGGTFRPSVAEVVGAIRRDPGAPTFAEAYRLIFGSKGVLAPRVQPGKPPAHLTREQVREQAILGRAAECHPLVHSFVVRQTPDRLLGLPVNDPDWGEKTRRDLEQEWNRHVEAFDGREVAALASGRGRGQLGQLDPLRALGGPMREIEATAREQAA